jgi:phosphoserine phosphatase/dolichol kinase
MSVQQKRRCKLVVFDVEGVLMPKKRYLFFELGRNLGFSHFVQVIFFGFLYELGLISLKSALKRIFKAFKGFKTDELLQVFRQVPLLPDVEKVFKQLKIEGFKIALISSGLPTLVVQDLTGRLGADYAVGFELGVKESTLTGEIWGDVLEREGKLPVLMKILKTEGLNPKDCCVVADDRNNVSIFLPEVLSIGYNPDFSVRMKANIILNSKLTGILPIIEGESKEKASLPSRNDVLREIIHACGFVVPILSGLFGTSFAVLLIATVTFLYVTSELARMDRKNLPVISSITRGAATQSELYEFAPAPIFFALGILFTLLIFPYSAAGVAIAIFCLGDSTASIFGKVFGRTVLPFNKGKSLEGSLFGFFFAFLAGSYFVNPWVALVGAAVAMAVESLPLPLNDNLVTPIVIGAVLSLMLL